MKSITDRFLEKFERRTEDECWPWTSATSSGYGRLSTHYGYEYAHRLSYKFHVGPIPEGQVVRHRCDNPVCVNPKHLVLGTQAQNMNDAVERRRFPVGDDRATTLTERDVREILVSRESAERLGEKYGVCADYIRMIWRGVRWSHVDISDLPKRLQNRREHGRYGEGHYKCKLTAEKARAIRNDPRTQREIAKDYGISAGTVADIKLRKTWRNID